MATIEELLVKISADVEGLNKGLADSQAAVKRSTDKMTQLTASFSAKSSKNIGIFETAMGTMGGFIAGSAVTGAFSVLKSAASGMYDVLKDGINEARQTESAMARLAAAMRMAGTGGMGAAREFKTFADSLEEVYLVEGDAILSSAALLETLTKLDKNGLEEATRSAVILSQALGIDLDAATKLVAKGANGSTEAFARYGIKIKEGTSSSETFANVLKSIGGLTDVAKAKTNTFEGALTKIDLTWKNLKETLGQVILSNPAVMKSLEQVGVMLGKLGKYLEDNKEVVGQFVSGGIYLLSKSLAFLVEEINSGYKKMLYFIAGIKAVGTVTMATFEAIKKGASGDIDGAFDKLNTASENIKKSFAEIAKDNAFDIMATGLNKVGDTAAISFNSVVTTQKEAQKETVITTAKINEQAEALSTYYAEARAGQDEFIKGLLNQSASVRGQLDYQLEYATENHEMGLTSDEEYYQAKLEALTAFYDGQQEILDQRLQQDTIRETEYQAASVQLNKNRASELNAVNVDQVKSVEESEKEKASAISDSLDTIATLSTSKNKQLAAIGKTAGIAQAIRSTYIGANKALEKVPPPFSYILAAGVIAAGMANVAKIRATKAAKGIDSVPGIGSFDNFPAILAPGERVVPRETNKDLRSFLDSNKGMQAQGGTQRIELSLKGDLIEMIEARLIERIRNGTSLRIV